MSKIALTGDVSGTGTLTIAAPNTNTDRTLTLPDSAGTMMLTDTGVTTAQMPAGSVIQAVQYYDPNNAGSYTTSTTFIASGIKKSITPIFSNSLIIIQAHISMAYASSSGKATLYLNGSLMSGAGQYAVGYTVLGYDNYSGYSVNAQYQATSTSALEFEIYVAAPAGTYTYIHPTASASMTLWEIAA